MMLPTHVLVGLAVAAPVALVAPELASAALAGALLGSVLPDLDLYTGHRRRLHYPTGYALATLPAALGAWYWRTPLLFAVAFALLGAALHCRMDRYGGGLELRPWEGTSDRAVYDHVRGRWRAPKRWIRYDGAPEDVAFALAIGLPVVAFVEGPFRLVAVAALIVGAAYALLRRRLAAVVPLLVGLVPAVVHRWLPERYRTGSPGHGPRAE